MHHLFYKLINVISIENHPVLNSPYCFPNHFDHQRNEDNIMIILTFYTGAQTEKHSLNLRCHSKESLAPSLRNDSTCNKVSWKDFVLVVQVCLYSILRLSISGMQREV